MQLCISTAASTSSSVSLLRRYRILPLRLRRPPCRRPRQGIAPRRRHLRRRRPPCALLLVAVSSCVAMRRAWSVVTPLALATVDDPEEVNVASRHFQFRLCPLLRLLHCHDHDTVALHVPHTSFIPHLVLCQIIMFVDGGGSAHALPP